MLFLFNSTILLFCWHILQIFEPGQKSLQTFPRLQRASQGLGSQQDPVYKSSLSRHMLRASANHQPWVWVGDKTSFRSVCWLPPQTEGSFFRIDQRVHKIVPLMQNCFYFLRVMKASNKQKNQMEYSSNRTIQKSFLFPKSQKMTSQETNKIQCTEIGEHFVSETERIMQIPEKKIMESLLTLRL